MTDIVAPPTIDALPPGPRPTDTPAEFDSKGFATIQAQEAMVPQINAAAAATHQNAVATHERAVSAASSASTATTQADAAMGYRNTAQSAATTATTKAAEAEASAIAASKLNLGDKATPPTTDNQGAALLAGATYYDTTLGKWRVWTGAAWGDGISAVAGVASLNGRAGNVTLTSTDVGLNNVNNTADSVKAVASAAKLTTARTINGVSFDGQANISIPGNPTVVATSGGVMNCAAGDSFTITVSANTTLSFSNIPSGAYACVLEVVHTSGAITFPAGTVWVGEVTPTLATGKRHLFFFQRAKLGTASWYASALTGFAS